MATLKKIVFEIDPEYLENFSSRHTRNSYKTDLEQFFEYIRDRDAKIKDYNQIQRIHIIRYRNYLIEMGGQNGNPAAPKTVSRKLASLSSYFDYLVERNYTKFNPCTSVKRPRREVVSPTNALNAQQVKELFNAIDETTPSGILHMALLTTFFTTGLRKSEILFLKRRHFKKVGKFWILEYKGKGGKLGQKILHQMAVEKINNYIDFMESIERKHHKEDWLFQPTRNPANPKLVNKPLNPKTINEILDNYALKIGLGIKVSPHSARATFIGELLDNGVDIYTIAQEVNHSSVTTTQEYDKRKKKWEDSPIHKLKFK
ncbi:MAG: tyrosine-type recombinase/integrase [Bdellovibrionales bacterium]|nr:tyrosine-type recombinase/integrase [Bdellovibrionales bacterium]